MVLLRVTMFFCPIRKKVREILIENPESGEDENLPLLLAKIAKTKSIYRLPQEAGLASKI